MMQDTEKKEIYEQARLLAGENTEESLEEAMRLFQSIPDWQDAGKQYADCRTRLGRLQWQRESARLKVFEERHEKQMARRRKAGLILLVAVLLIFALISTVALIKYYRYNKATERYLVGEYERAIEAFMEMADYKNSREMIYLSAVELFRLKRYEEALPVFVWLDGFMDHGYYLRKCREKLGLEP